MDPVALLGLVGLLFIKEAGLPVPVPGDLLVLGAGVAAAGDPASGGVVLLAILVAVSASASPSFAPARCQPSHLDSRPSAVLVSTSAYMKAR